MARATVTRRLAVPPDRLWKLLSDFSDLSWAPVGSDAVEVQGQGPGMVRIISGAVRERLEAIDDAGRSLVYSIPEGNPLPVNDYRATVSVADAQGGSALTWSCEFEPKDVSEAEARAAVEAMYGTMIGWVADHLGAGPPAEV